MSKSLRVWRFTFKNHPPIKTRELVPLSTGKSNTTIIGHNVPFCRIRICQKTIRVPLGQINSAVSIRKYRHVPLYHAHSIVYILRISNACHSPSNNKNMSLTHLHSLFGVLDGEFALIGILDTVIRPPQQSAARRLLRTAPIQSKIRPKTYHLRDGVWQVRIFHALFPKHCFPHVSRPPRWNVCFVPIKWLLCHA